jgi:hypothetical protein
MSNRINHGRPRRRGGFASKFWNFVNNIVSSIFLTISVLLVLVALAEVFVYLIDAGVNRSGTYLDWWRGPLIIFFSAIPFLGVHLILRFNLISRLRNRIRRKAPPKKIETIDLD